MNQVEFERELAAFDEKIGLAKLEASKAESRVRELEYQKARFILDLRVALCKQADESKNHESSYPGRPYGYV